jgi:hypothetical protein
VIFMFFPLFFLCSTACFKTSNISLFKALVEYDKMNMC